MRFSLTALLVATGAIALGCGVFFALPDAIAAWVLVVFSLTTLPTLAVAGIVYGRGYQRAFSIGCLASMAWSFSLPVAVFLDSGSFGLAEPFDGSDSDSTFKIMYFILFATVLIGGAAAMFVRWLCIRSNSVPAHNQRPEASMGSPNQMTPHDRAELYAILQGRLAAIPTHSENGRNESSVAGEAAQNR